MKVTALPGAEEELDINKSNIIAITNPSTVNTTFQIENEAELSGPDDKFIQGFAVVLQLERSWRVEWGAEEIGRSRGRAGQKKPENDLKTASISTHHAYEVVVDLSEEDATADWWCYVAFGLMARIIVLFEQAPGDGSDEDLRAKVDDKGLFKVSEVRVDVLFACPSVPTLCQMCFNVRNRTLVSNETMRMGTGLCFAARCAVLYQA